MARIIGIGVNGIDAEDEFRHPLLWTSDRGAGSVDCFRGSVASPLISPLFGWIPIVRFDVVHVSPTGLDEEKPQASIDFFTK